MAENLGRALALEPFLSSAFAISMLFSEIADERRRDRLLSDLLAGETIFALAHGEAADALASSARHHDGGYVLDGKKAMVSGGQHADDVLVSVREHGERGDE